MIRTIADDLPGMIAFWDKALICQYANRACQRWFDGADAPAIIGRDLRSVLGDTLYRQNEPHIRAVCAGEPQQFERTIHKSDGTTVATLADYIPQANAAGEVVGFIMTITDVTLLKQAQVVQRLAAGVYDNLRDAIIVQDADLRIVSVNKAFTDMTGHAAGEAIGQTTSLLEADRDDDDIRRSIMADIDCHGFWHGELWSRRKNGDAFLASSTTTMIPGEPIHYVTVIQDYTESWRNNERLLHLALHDALTDLPNRLLFMDRLDQFMRQKELADQPVLVMFADLDGFKAINDRFGHDVGDALLKAVAVKLSHVVRRVDAVARLGGDEFVVVLDDPPERVEVEGIAERIISALNEPMRILNAPCRVGVSIGIASSLPRLDTPAGLLAKADKAMYAAKKAGRNAYRFHDEIAEETVGEAVPLISRLRLWPRSRAVG